MVVPNWGSYKKVKNPFTQWRNGDFAALPPILRPRRRAGRTFEKNVPEKFRKKMTFFDQKAVF